jgi:hypothetical protein
MHEMSRFTSITVVIPSSSTRKPCICQFVPESLEERSYLDLDLIIFTSKYIKLAILPPPCNIASVEHYRPASREQDIEQAWFYKTHPFPRNLSGL